MKKTILFITLSFCIILMWGHQAIAQNMCYSQECTIEGTGGTDTLTGTSGADVICCFGGNDTVNAGGGNDWICGGDGNDTLNGEGGNDIILSGNGDDAVNGGSGTDEAHYGDSNTTVWINLVTGETIEDGGDVDTLSSIENAHGSLYADELTGNGNNNILKGVTGGDGIDGGLGTDTCNGGVGCDTCDIDCETTISCEDNCDP